MAGANQLLFNLNVPYNPMNMVTQFYNPGPVVIERLPGAELNQKKNEPAQGGLQQAPVEFSVVSKEKLDFAMQLARRDMKNKIMEQQQKHLKLQNEKGNNAGKTVKGKVLQKKNGRPQQPSRNLQRNYTKNINVNTKSVKTQTPPSVKDRTHRRKLVYGHASPKGSPVLVLQSQPQSFPDFEGRVKQEVKRPPVHQARAEVTKDSSGQQKHEIARLNKELQTCMEKINILSKQVSESKIVASPDRSSMLRAGLQALMRVDSPFSLDGQRSDTTRASPRRQRRPLPQKQKKLIQPASKGVLIPSRQRVHKAPVSTSEVMHFTQPTESTRSKAKPPLGPSQMKTPGTAKPAWAPPGSPESIRRIRQVEIRESLRSDLRSRSAHLHSEDVDGEGDLVDKSPRRSRVDAGERRRDDAEVLESKSKFDKKQRLQGNVDHETERRTTSYYGKEIGGSNIQQRTENDFQQQSRLHGQIPEPSGKDWKGIQDFNVRNKGKLSKVTDSQEQYIVDRLYEDDAKSIRFKTNSIRGVGAWNDEIEWNGASEEIHTSRPSVRRKVQFGGQANKMAPFDHYSDDAVLDVHDDEHDREPERRFTRTAAGATKGQRYFPSDSGGSVRRGIIGHDSEVAEEHPLDRPHGRLGRMQSEPSLKKTEDHVADFLVDEILEDAVQEMAKVRAENVVTRQAQNLQGASTLENMLQDLELMELEEEQIRRRWKHVNYDDPCGVRGSSQSQVSNLDKQVWMQGTPLDAQQMERLDEIPLQHTAMHFTQDRSKGTPSVQIVAPKTSNDDDVDDDNSPVLPIVIQTATHPERKVRHPVEHASKHFVGGKTSNDEKFPVFVPSGAFKRIFEGRNDFERHLKRTSHLSYGTFDPWKLVERISDELVDEILNEITGEVSDVIGNYVETLYASEFNIETEKAQTKH